MTLTNHKFFSEKKQFQSAIKFSNPENKGSEKRIVFQAREVVNSSLDYWHRIISSVEETIYRDSLLFDDMARSCGPLWVVLW